MCRLLCDLGQATCPLWTLAAFCKPGLDALCLFEGKSRVRLCLWFLEQAQLWASRSGRSWNSWAKAGVFSLQGALVPLL